MALVAPQDQIASLYAGFFGRPAEPAGLSYWVGRLNDGLSLSSIAQSFATQSEATTLHPFLANPTASGAAAFLIEVYSNLFSRTIDAAGLAWWTGQLNSGRPVGQVILDLVSGAQGNDQLAINNKVTVALAYAQAFNTADRAWTTANLDSARSVLAGVTFDSKTVAEAQESLVDIVTVSPPPLSTTMSLGNAGDSVALAGTVGTIVLTGGDLAFYPAAAFGTIAQANALGIASIVSTAGGTLNAAANDASTIFNFNTGVVSGSDPVDAKLTYQGFTAYIASNFGDGVVLTASGQNATGGNGADMFVAVGGDHALAGGPGADTFNLVTGTNSVSDLGSGGGDVAMVAAGATLIGTATAAWSATPFTFNYGTATVRANANSVSVAQALGTGGWTLTNAGSAAGVNLTGSSNADFLIGGSGPDALVGGNGNDDMTGGGGNDTMTGGDGADTFRVLGSRDAAVIRDVGGGDVVIVGSGAIVSGVAVAAWTADATTSNAGTVDIEAAGFAIDLASASGASGWTLANSGGATALTGSRNNDTITGGTGGDTLNGGGGDDTIVAGAGADILNGGAGADTLSGGNGADTLSGGAGNDAMRGGQGNDLFRVDGGADTISDLGAGADELVVSAGATLDARAPQSWAPTAMTSNAGGATITAFANDVSINLSQAGGAGSWTLTNAGSGAPAYFIGSANADTLIAGSNGGLLAGGRGADLLIAGAGRDTIGSGDDFAAAGQGIVASGQNLTAAIGAGQTLVFNTGTVAAVDRVSDFRSGTDKLDVASAGIAATSLIGADGNAALVGFQTYVLYGSWSAGIGTFTVAASHAAGTAQDALVFQGNGVLSANSHTGTVVLTGLNQALHATDFI